MSSQDVESAQKELDDHDRETAGRKSLTLERKRRILVAG